jgi:hypothetical protein
LRDAFEQVERIVPEDATVLSLWTYDTYFHAHRAATWPIAWGQARRPVEMFRTEDPERFTSVMDSLEIGYILVPQSAPLQPFDGSNYPESFIRCVQSLVESGELQLVWGSERYALLRRPPERLAIGGREARARMKGDG